MRRWSPPWTTWSTTCGSEARGGVRRASLCVLGALHVAIVDLQQPVKLAQTTFVRRADWCDVGGK